MPNDEKCVRCGACCIYFTILDYELVPEAKRVFKRSGQICPNLIYNPDSNTTGCRIHEESRPRACEEFFCRDGHLSEEKLALLRKTALDLLRILSCEFV